MDAPARPFLVKERGDLLDCIVAILDSLGGNDRAIAKIELVFGYCHVVRPHNRNQHRNQDGSGPEPNSVLFFVERWGRLDRHFGAIAGYG